ncbi:MAG: tRNA lysidine(34) synthetase TilS [Desulfovibrionaceae bacterium]
MIPPTLQDLPPKAARLCLDVERFVREQLAGLPVAPPRSGAGDAGTPAGASGDTASAGGEASPSRPSGAATHPPPHGQRRTPPAAAPAAPGPKATEPRPTVLVAFSGGVDSTALLLILHYLAPRLGWRIAAAHCDHMLRPESAAEARDAADQCAALGIPFLSEAVDVAALAHNQGMGIEEAGREARYAFLEHTRRDQGATLIATGHHLDDLAEDVLMRLVRGTGWPALAGMEAFAPDRALLRPLLLTPKAQLRAFAAAIGTPWSEDASNQDRAFLRNRVRHGILPLFTAENPAFLDAVAGLWRLARVDAAFWSQEVAAALATALPGPSTPPPSAPSGLQKLDHINSACYTSSEQSLDILQTSSAQFAVSGLAALPQATRLRLYKQCLEALGPGQPLLTTLLALDTAVLTGDGNKNFQFPGNKQARLHKGTLTFKKNS